jgi:hypothetical protein
MMLFACVVAQAAQNSVIGQLEGATIVASDGQFLGIISENAFDSKSIANEYGDYGSQYSSTSIFNEFGDYGGEFSDKSPFNEFTNDPPKIFTRGNKWAYLSANSSLSPRVDPRWLIGMIRSAE